MNNIPAREAYRTLVNKRRERIRLERENPLLYGWEPPIWRVWAMPNADTFSIPDIGAFVQRHIMGPEWILEELMLVCHGGDHNDTICMAERHDTRQGVLW